MSIPKVEEGFILTAGWWLIGNCNGNPDQPIGRNSQLVPTPPELRDGIAYPFKNETPFCIVHQYERGTAWSPNISKRYVIPFLVEDDTPAVKASLRTKRGGPNKYAKDGLTLDWFEMHNIG